MTQTTINQRIKFLVDTLSPSARAFSEAIQESPTNTFNYIGGRLVEPRAEYLAKIIRHFGNVNAHWLLIGEGEPFVGEAPAAPVIHQRKIKGDNNIMGDNIGSPTVQLTDCKKDLQAANEKIDLLKGQIQDKERLIQLYERQLPTK